MHVCVCVYDYRLGKMETKMFDQKFSLWNCMWPETLRLASSAYPPNILPSIIHPQVYCCLLCFLPATIAGEGYMEKAMTRPYSLTSVVSSAHSLAFLSFIIILAALE